MRWFFDWHDMEYDVQHERLAQVLAHWRIPTDDDDDDSDGDGDIVVEGLGGDDDGSGDSSGDDDDDPDDWRAFISSTLLLRIPLDVGREHGVRTAPEDGESYAVTFGMVAQPDEGVVMEVDEDSLDNKACASLLQRLGDEIASALGGRLSEAEFEKRFRADDDDVVRVDDDEQ